jgi:tetratricopeptide (TPR) repeat protein
VLALGVALLGSCRERPVPTLSATDSALQKAGALAAARSYTAAEDILRQALEADPGDHRTALGLADLYDVWKRPDAGLAALGTAMEQGAAVAQTAPLRLRFLAMAGDWAQVLTTADAQLAADPTDLEALTALTQAQLHLGACDEALVTARQATAARPADAALATTYAILSVDTARLAGLDPPLVEGILPCGQDCDRTIGLRLVRRGCWELAACLLARAATSSPEDAEIHAWLGEGYARLGLQAEAERALNRAVELDPELPQAWLLLGKHMLAAGSLDQARVALLKAHALDPENPAPCLAVAELKAQMSRYDEIERWANAALERAPTDAEIAKAVARVYLSRRLADASAAVTAVELSVRLSPDDGEAKMLLGASHLLRGNVEEALNALDDAVTLAPDLAEAHFWRARALEAVGRPRDADAARITAADLGYPAPVD